MFDIVAAGTSIGSMNGVIVVSSVTEEGKSLEDMKAWEDSAKLDLDQIALANQILITKSLFCPSRTISRRFLKMKRYHLAS